MSSDVAIRIEGLGKAYTIRHQEQQITLAEQALQRLRHPLHRAPTETFWALSGIDLEIRRGEVIGLIGRNGAGKSTLLKILSRITAPTTGRVELYGRVGSLLEVGTGFHPELTGRENVYLNGSILGMRKPEISRHFDAIVEFAGVERFLDTPVKRYSSGMYVRLAFAVAAHLDTEILLVDEVLAVGDAEFQRRCLGKMHDVTSEGRTVILVSHNLNAVSRLAQHSALLDGGSVVAFAPTASVLEEYRALVGSGWALARDGNPTTRSKAATIAWIRVLGSSELVSGVPLQFQVGVEVNLPLTIDLSVGLILRHHGHPIGSDLNVIPIPDDSRTLHVVTIALATQLLARGTYTISIGIGAMLPGDLPDSQSPDVLEDAITFDMTSVLEADWLDRVWNEYFGSIRLNSDVLSIEACDDFDRNPIARRADAE